MIRWLLLLLVAVFWTADVFTGDISLAPGLSLKNAMLYLIAAGLILRKAMGETSPLRLSRMQAYFALWIGYAFASTMVAGLIVRYSGYHLISAVIELKSQIVDPAIFFFAVFYGLRSEDDVRFFLKGLIGAIGLANVLTLAAVAGVVGIDVPIGTTGVEYGRVFGFFGHANETAVLIASLLPAMIVLSTNGSFLNRTLWSSGTVASVIVFILTVSRGAYVATAVSTVWGAWLCRRYLDLAQLLRWAFIVLVVLAAAVALAAIIDPFIWDVLKHRIFGQTDSIDVGVISSGRTDLWAAALDRMMDAPITFLTGFGWYVYQFMPFQLGTHNYYIELWFDLGLPGVAMFLLIMRRWIAIPLGALEQATAEERRYLIAFVCGVLAFLVGEMFSVMFVPVPYVFMYAGAMLHMAMALQSRHRVSATAASLPISRVRPRARGIEVGAR